MIDAVTEYDVVNEVLLARDSFTGAIVVLEGGMDAFTLERFFDRTMAKVIVAHGKENAVGAATILDADGEPGIVAIVDADFWRPEGISTPSPNIVLSDGHDVEIMIISSSAFDRIVAEYASVAKTHRFIARVGGPDLRGALLSRALPIAYLRLASIRRNMRLCFKEIEYDRFVDKETLEVNVPRLVRHVISKTLQMEQKREEGSTVKARKQVNIGEDAEIVALVRSISAETASSPEELCCGHDVTALFALGLRKCYGSQNQSIASQENMESVLRLSFDTEEFRRTTLWVHLKEWESKNVPYRILKV
jgi:CBS domain-containing protein